MEKRYNLEQAQNEAQEIRKKALEMKAERQGSGEPSNDDYEKSHQSLQEDREKKEEEDQEKLDEVRQKIEKCSSDKNISEMSDDDLNFADNIEKIFLSGDAEQLERLRLHHNLTQEQADMYQKFTILEKDTKGKMEQQFKERIVDNPEPSAQELEMGVYKEDIEPQVYDAVVAMRDKGYNTYESGFYGPDKQRIGFEGNPLSDVEISNEIISLAKEKGLKVEVLSDAIVLYYDKFVEIDEIKGVWDKIARELPDLEKKAKPTSIEAAKLFKSRVENIKKNPQAWIED